MYLEVGTVVIESQQPAPLNLSLTTPPSSEQATDLAPAAAGTSGPDGPDGVGSGTEKTMPV